MPVFTVHMPFAGTGAGAAEEKAVFVRDGFHFWAFVFGPLWLLARRLWLAAFVYLALLLGLELAMSWLQVGASTRVPVMALIALLLGFEATSLLRWSYGRGRWREVGLVVAPDRESAERRFFAHWTGEDRGSAYVERQPPQPPQAASTVPPSDIIGLFPQPGGQR